MANVKGKTATKTDLKLAEYWIEQKGHQEIVRNMLKVLNNTIFQKLKIVLHVKRPPHLKIFPHSF